MQVADGAERAPGQEVGVVGEVGSSAPARCSPAAPVMARSAAAARVAAKDSRRWSPHRKLRHIPRRYDPGGRDAGGRRADQPPARRSPGPDLDIRPPSLRHLRASWALERGPIGAACGSRRTTRTALLHAALAASVVAAAPFRNHTLHILEQGTHCPAPLACIHAGDHSTPSG